MSMHISAAPGEIAENVILPGDPLRAKYIAETYLTDAVRVNEIRNTWGYTGTYKGQRISVMSTGMGAPSMLIYATELCREYGCKKLLRLGKTAIGLFHGSPADHDEQLFADTPDKRLRELAADTACQVVVVGHSHSPFHRCVAGVHFINPGSVGRMFDGNPAASYALLDLDQHRIEVSLHRCVYDVEAVVRALAQHQLPAVYAEMFRTGTKLN